MRSTAIAVVMLTACLGAQTTPPGLTNYNRVDATVACAGATPDLAMPAIKADGFKALINLRRASEQGVDVEASKRAAAAAGLNYIHIPFSGAETEAVDQFLAAVKDPGNSPVLIHCATANRAGMMLMVKRVMVDGWPLEKAAEEAERAGMKNPKLKAFAIEYLKSHGKA